MFNPKESHKPNLETSLNKLSMMDSFMKAEIKRAYKQQPPIPSSNLYHPRTTKHPSCAHNHNQKVTQTKRIPQHNQIGTHAFFINLIWDPTVTLISEPKVEINSHPAPRRETDMVT